MSNTASYDNHENINSLVSFSFLYGNGTPLGGCRSSAISVLTGCPIYTKLKHGKSILSGTWLCQQGLYSQGYVNEEFLPKILVLVECTFDNLKVRGN